ncbi:MAG: hypothetical protein PHN52_09700 [candidate division Zixibacteria bacterium]|nr:hypothetical protein [candidate division Zixibacteria bacterium]
MKQACIGIDCRSKYFYTARVGRVQDTYHVQTLARVEKEPLRGQPFLAGHEITFGLPDKDVIVKSLHLKDIDAVDPASIIRFEMACSLLDDEDEFAYDYLPAGDNGRYLALVHHKSCRETLLNLYGFEAGDEKQSVPRYKMRALALGDGYLGFCRCAPTELVCLADFNLPLVSICFIYRQRIVDLAYMTVDRNLSTGPAALDMLAADFKTMVNFRLGLLAEQRWSLPLTSLVVTGDGISEDFKTILKKYFLIEVGSPPLLREYFDGCPENKEIPFEKYLVALGLAVN